MSVAVVLFSGQSLIDRWFRPGQEFEGVLAMELFKTAFLNENPQYSDLIMIDGATGGTPMFGTTKGFITTAGDDFTPGPQLLHAYDQIDAALAGGSNLDFVGTVWGQGHGNTGQLGRNWETGDYNSLEPKYQAGMEWVLDALESYVTDNHSGKLTAQSDDPQVFIQHIGRRTLDDEDSVDGLNDIKDIQAEVADNDPNYHLASEGYDLEMPDGTHPSPEAFHELATRMAHYISTGEQGPKVTAVEVYNQGGSGKVVLAIDVSGSISASDIVLNADGKDFLQVIDTSVLASGGFAQVQSIEIESAQVSGNKIIFDLAREVDGSSVTVSYGYAGVLSDTALSGLGDQDTVVEPIGVNVTNPADPSTDLFLPMAAFREEINVVDGSGGVDIGSLKRGIAAKDNFSGEGYILYTEDNLRTVFGTKYSSKQATNMMAVYNDNGDWYYFKNETAFSFSPSDLTNPILIASVDYANDEVNMLAGQDFTVEGVQAGYFGGTLNVVPNQWNGSYNAGEFGIQAGTLYPHEAASREPEDIGSLKRGIPAKDSFTGEGYILYNADNLKTIYGSTYPGNQATNFMAVYHDGDTWFRFKNESAFEFDPEALSNATLIASVDFGSDTVTMLEDESGFVEGVQFGYASGTLDVVANQYNGSSNDGEFEMVSGSLVLNASHEADTGSLGRGIAAKDSFDGTGHILYTTDNLEDLYGSTYSNRQAEHFVAVYNEGDEWFRFKNESAIAFSPEELANATLVAEVDYGADIVTMLDGTNSVVAGVQAGYAGGTFNIVANQWNGSSNAGEFGLQDGTLYLHSDDYLLG